jgi:hypothetical protein
MSDIELRNVDGAIVGYDPETGERVPVSFEGLDVSSVATSEVAGIADHVITTKADLQALPDELSSGETVWIGRVEHDEVVEIDGVDNVTITGSGMDSSRVTTADGSNSGLFHVGRNSPVGKITIKNITIDGNSANNSGDTDFATPIWTGDVDELVVDTISFVDTIEPDGRSNTSTIRAYYPTRRVKIRDCEFHGNVTRHVESSCRELHVTDSFFENAIERSISLDSFVPNNRLTQRAFIRSNDLRVGPEGSAVGAHVGGEGLDSTFVGAAPVDPVGDPIEKYVFRDNDITGVKRVGFAIRDATQGEFEYINNDIEGAEEHGIINIRTGDSDQSIINPGSITIHRGTIRDTGAAAIQVGNSSNINISEVIAYDNPIKVSPADSASIDNCEVFGAVQSPSIAIGGISNSGHIRNCTVQNPSRTAILTDSPSLSVEHCDVTGAAENYDTIRVTGDECRIVHCYVEGVPGALPRHAIFCPSINNVVAIGNIAKNIGGNVVQLHRSTGISENNYTQPVESS